MASSSGSAVNEELQCSICLEVFTDPVTTPCGHNFCRTCLSKSWMNTQTCFCPFCKEEFSKRPDLKINTTLREVAQHFKKNLNIEESEVFSDICDERKQKAVHYICPKHDRPLEMFCKDDQTSCCLFCTEGEHRNHNTVPIEEKSRDKKNQLVKRQDKIQDRNKKIREIQGSVERKKTITEKEKSSSVEIFTDLIRSIERCQSEQLKMMEEQQKEAEKQADVLIKELQQEISELEQEITELEQLSHTDDHLHLIQMKPSQCNPPHNKDLTEIRIDSDVNVNSLYTALTELKKTLHGTLNKKLSLTGIKTAQTYAVDVTLDPDTANPYLILSDDGKQVRHGDIKRKVPKPPKRFDKGLCVLAKEGFSSGRFYYEVQVKGKTEWELGVIRESINRKVKIILSPDNGHWTVSLRNENQYKACESPPVSLSLKVKPEKVGVFVDYEEGLVSFYDVDSRAHIYSFTGQTFTEKLYPYFSPGLNDKGKNSKPLIITPVS